jgi:hypothetical protein
MTRRGGPTSFAVGRGVIAFEVTTLGRMGRIATPIRISQCRPRYHLTGVPGVPPVAAGDLGVSSLVYERHRPAAVLPNAGLEIAGSTDVSGY